MDKFLFCKLTTCPDLFPRFQIQAETLFDQLMSNEIDVLTIDQGTADWHTGRHFSLTSSQSDGSFRMAFIIFQENDNWCAIARYLEGDDYHASKYYLSLWF